MSPAEYRDIYTKLNCKQKEMVDFNRSWCLDAVISLRKKQPIKPYFIFLSGSAGVGKSYVIRLVEEDIKK